MKSKETLRHALKKHRLKAHFPLMREKSYEVNRLSRTELISFEAWQAKMTEWHRDRQKSEISVS